MIKFLSVTLFICTWFNVFSQSPAGPETVNIYSIAQKQLLILSTAKFTNIITVNNLDRDSVVLVACKVTGLPFLDAYKNDNNSSTEGEDLINNGKMGEAIQLSKKLTGNNRVLLLIKLATWYLHRAGTKKNDLDNANKYLRDALVLNDTGNINLHYESLMLLGEYYRQAGNETESRKIFLQVASESQQKENKKITAKAWHQLGKMHADIDSIDLVYLSNSLALYEQLTLKEKEIELLWEIADYYIKTDKNLAEKYLKLILRKQDSIGFKHSLFAEYELSHICVVQSKFLDALQHANAALVSMNASGMTALKGTFNMRVGVAYFSLGKTEEAFAWYKKGLEDRTADTHIFWYKSLIYATSTLALDMNQPQEALTLLNDVVDEFPPMTSWEKAQVLTTKGVLNQILNRYRLTEECYLSFLALITEHPEINRLGEFNYDYSEIAKYYISKSNIKTARLFANQLMAANGTEYFETYSQKYFLLSNLDSLSGNYKSALNNYRLYKLYYDSSKAIDQRKAFDELTIKYGAEQKDKNIQLLQKDKEIQGAKLLQQTYTRNWILGAVALLLVIVGLLVYNGRLKQQTNKRIELQNTSLLHLLKEKDWLVKEIHHRVKNNLQTIMGLLGTQAGYQKNEVVANAITDSQRRIQSMSLIHQKLYQTDNLSAINMADYIHELVDSLKDSFNTNNHIRFNLEIDAIEMDLAHCIPLGLILNEAITNSFKYAFPNNAAGIISISLKHASPNQIFLVINDNGAGLPSSFNINNTESMGMNLMRGLSEEIGAKFKIDSQNGTKMTVSFEYNPDIAIEISPIKTKEIQSI
jgi:two-component sensor histidine kinase